MAAGTGGRLSDRQLLEVRVKRRLHISIVRCGKIRVSQEIRLLRRGTLSQTVDLEKNFATARSSRVVNSRPTTISVYHTDRPALRIARWASSCHGTRPPSATVDKLSTVGSLSWHSTTPTRTPTRTSSRGSSRENSSMCRT